MKERPIIFTGEMVQAILAGRKTQTRRVMKPQPEWGKEIQWTYISGFWCAHDGRYFCADGSIGEWRCPYGQSDDLLWVKEGWAVDEDDQLVIFYRATDHDECGQPWHSSRFMPRRISRIDLRIKGIGVGRVQNISEEDAKAEGCEPIVDALWNIYYQDGFSIGYRLAYEEKWNSINANRGYSWDSNPWVWIIEFVEEEKKLN